MRGFRGLVLLVWILSTALLAGCGGTQPTDEAVSEQRTNAREAADGSTTARQRVSVGVGEEADLGEMGIRVFGVRSEPTIHVYPGPGSSPSSRDSSSGEYIAVDYVARNSSSGTLTVEPEAMLEDSEGNSYSQDGSIEPPTSVAEGRELQPDGSLASTLFFEVPDGASPKSLRLSYSGAETAIDLTSSEPGEIPATDYLEVYHLWFDQRAYEEIYGLLDPTTTQDITLGDWLSYFDDLWGEWYLGLDSLTPLSEDSRTASYKVDRTFYETGGNVTPSPVVQEMVRDGERWKLVMRDDQINDILAAQETPPASAEQKPEETPDPGRTDSQYEEEQPVQGPVIVRITGDPGQRFSGSYGNLDTIESVDGTTPQDFSVESVDTGFLSMDTVTANAQKTAAGGGELVVQIVVDGEVVKEASTTAKYGIAQVNWSPSE